MDQFYCSTEFQNFFARSTQSLVVKADSPVFTVMAVSDKFLNMTRRQRSDLIGKALFDIFRITDDDGDERRLGRQAFDDVITRGEAIDLPVFKHERKGSATDITGPLYWTLHNEPLKDADGKVAYIINTTRIVNEEVMLKKAAAKAESVASELQGRFNEMLMHAPLGIAFFSRDNYLVQYANEAICRMWNKGMPAEVLGIPVFDLLPRLEENGFRPIYDEVIRTGIPYVAYDSRVTYQRNDEPETFYFDLHFAPVYNSVNDITGLAAMAYDVTQQIEDRKTIAEAEERLRLAAEAAHLGTWDLDLETGKLIHTRRLAELLGYQGDTQLMHTMVRVNMLDEDRPIVEKAFDEAMQCGAFFYEVRVKWPDESIHWIRTLGKVLYNEEKQPVRMLGSIIDITERVEAEQHLNEINRALEQEIRKFEIVTDFAPQIIWSATPGGSIDFVNKGWSDFTGLSREAAYANSWEAVIHPEDYAAVKQAWEDSVGLSQGYQIEYRIKKYNGEYEWHLERGQPMTDDRGRIMKWFGATVNINAHIELQKQKDNFLAIASHELKTPVTSIKAYTQVLEMMLRNAGDNDKADMVNKMDVQVNRLTNLIADLLDVTKIDTGKLQFDDGYFDFATMLDEVIEELQRTTQKHRIVKNIDFTGQVYGDRNRISQVVINLLTNAIKYSPEADEVIVHCTRNGNEVRLCVQDFGIGISPDKKERVFEQFYRVNSNKQHTFPGLGLGLYISSEIIKREGGLIWVNSAEGKGSSFCFALPVDR